MEHRDDDNVFNTSTTHTHTSVSESEAIYSTNATGSRPPPDISQLLQLLVLERQQAEEQRREDNQRRREDNQRLCDILQALVTAHARSEPPAHSTSTPASSTTTPSSSTTQHKPHIQAPTPPSLKSDASFQMFREWRRKFDDYCVMVDFNNLPHDKQLIQLRMCLALET